MKNTVFGLVLGLIVGGLGVVVHAGFVGLPASGPVAGAILLASAAWFAEEWLGALGWSAFALAALGVTSLELLAPPSDDIVISMTPWVSRSWLLVAPISMLVPTAVKAVAASARRRRAAAEAPEEPVGEPTPEPHDPAGRVVRRPGMPMAGQRAGGAAGEPRHDA